MSQPTFGIYVDHFALGRELIQGGSDSDREGLIPYHVETLNPIGKTQERLASEIIQVISGEMTKNPYAIIRLVMHASLISTTGNTVINEIIKICGETEQMALLKATQVTLMTGGDLANIAESGNPLYQWTIERSTKTFALFTNKNVPFLYTPNQA